MKSVLIFLAFITFAVSSCKKPDTTPQTPTCDTGNICFKIGDEFVSQPAHWRAISATRIRLEWEKMEGNKYKNTQIDVWATTTGTLDIKAAGSNSGATFQYFISDVSSGKNYKGQSGTLTISAWSGDKLSGSFTVSAKDATSGETKEISSGTFADIPKQ